MAERALLARSARIVRLSGASGRSEAKRGSEEACQHQNFETPAHGCTSILTHAKDQRGQLERQNDFQCKQRGEE